jgi:hypothetical protein
MIRHMVLFRWKEGTTAEQVEAVSAALRTLPGLVPEIRHYSFGKDVGVNPGTFDYGVTALFDSVDGYLAYRDHPEHQRIVQQLVMPNVAERAACQFADALSADGTEG